jgi:hypothetical protein
MRMGRIEGCGGIADLVHSLPRETGEGAEGGWGRIEAGGGPDLGAGSNAAEAGLSPRDVNNASGFHL